MGQPDFASVGFFHFGTDHEHPIKALNIAIGEFTRRGGTLKDALIVLPEGFNLGRRYDDDSPANFEMAILGELQKLSSEIACAFVAGLIVRDTPGINPPYNSAYLIDGHKHKRLARKMLPDHTASGSNCWSNLNYTAHGTFENEAVVYRGVAVAALIL
jgi:predicted amidohydrolase